ncbi:hypothetical protein FRB99_000293 [Tulasnella sp. 403]|nr:hypothetical protein FRB99_000293 [Tulasnella sp. 403]
MATTATASSPITIPTAQKAWVVVRRGSPSQSLVLADDIPVLSDLGAGEILVKIHAAGLNPLGYKLTKYLPTLPFLPGRPYVAEYDFSGTVVKGNGSCFNDGDAVYGILRPFAFKRGQGALCQYISVPAEDVVRKPETISFNEAAGLSLSGITAYAALFDVAKLEPGQSVFVNGGSTAIGSLAIQIAKSTGCHVVATASATKITLVKSLGADEVIDYTQHLPHEYFLDNPPTPRFHVIYDSISDKPELFLNCEKYLAPSGTYVGLGAPIPYLSELPSLVWKYMQVLFRPTWLGGVKREWRYYIVGSTGWGRVLAAFNNMVTEGKVRPLVDSVYTFEDALKGYDRIMSERAVGKIIITAPSS